MKERFFSSPTSASSFPRDCFHGQTEWTFWRPLNGRPFVEMLRPPMNFCLISALWQRPSEVLEDLVHGDFCVPPQQVALDHVRLFVFGSTFKIEDSAYSQDLERFQKNLGCPMLYQIMRFFIGVSHMFHETNIPAPAACASGRKCSERKATNDCPKKQAPQSKVFHVFGKLLFQLKDTVVWCQYATSARAESSNNQSTNMRLHFCWFMHFCSILWFPHQAIANSLGWSWTSSLLNWVRWQQHCKTDRFDLNGPNGYWTFGNVPAEPASYHAHTQWPSPICHRPLGRGECLNNFKQVCSTKNK